MEHRLRRKTRILVLDDDPEVVSYLTEALDEFGFSTRGSTSPFESLEIIEGGAADLVVADVEMPEMRGTQFLTEALRLNPKLLVILITAFGTIELGVQAVRMGATDFVAKPFKIEVLLLSIERALRERQLRREIVRLRADLKGEGDGQIIAQSDMMKQILALARRAAATDLAVLITGESGTGKGMAARFIHDCSALSDSCFLQVNCAALPSQLIESELFGVKKGAFTDAKESRPGLFVEANGGTLFLDEVGELPLESQAKLLYVLETGRVRPLGGSKEIEISTRIIAATNQPLEEALKRRTFRPDLYYRLNVIRLELPPLRQRPDDIAPLADFFFSRAAKRLNRPLMGISASAMRKLISHPWPGNVRELCNTMERAVALAMNDTVCPEDILIEGSTPDSISDPLMSAVNRNAPLEQVEREYIQKVLSITGGNKVHAARILGIDRRTLRRKINEPNDD